MKQAVIDIGSNSMRLSVYETTPPQIFRVLFKEKIMAGLAGYVEHNALSPDGIERAILGLLSFRATLSELDLTDGLFVDIGGASTEVVRFAGGVMESANSCPVGSLKLYRDFVRKILPNKEAIHHMEKAITMATLGVVERPVRQGLPLVCVGGTARASLKLAKRVCRLPETSNSITIGQLDRVCQELCASQKQAADLILKIEPERIHTMIPGMLILRHMVQGFGAGRVIVSQYGVREGYLCQKILKAS